MRFHLKGVSSILQYQRLQNQHVQICFDSGSEAGPVKLFSVL